MKQVKNVAITVLAAALVALAMTSMASAREVITIQKANGGTYNITAYDTMTRSYYFINGSLDSDDYRITVPNGYGCTITVALGRRVGDRNLYEQKDPLSPIFEVKNKSTYVLELIYKGHGSSSVGTNSSPGTGGPGGIFGGGGGDGERQPPP